MGQLWGIMGQLWGSMGQSCIPIPACRATAAMELYGAVLWDCMELYGAIWGCMGRYGAALWGAMGQAPPYLLVEPQQLWCSMEQLWSSMGPYEALWGAMELYGAALWGAMGWRYGAGAPIPACSATAALGQPWDFMELYGAVWS